MKIQYDQEADALYMYLSKKKVARTCQVGENVIVDFDTKGGIIGIEMLFVSSKIPKAVLAKAQQIGVPAFA
jgi:uncharacterized protein YuzE